jgi:hypothetical protein
MLYIGSDDTFSPHTHQLPDRFCGENRCPVADLRPTQACRKP